MRSNPFQEWKADSIVEIVSGYLTNKELIDSETASKLQECLKLTKEARKLSQQYIEKISQIQKHSNKDSEFLLRMVESKGKAYQPAFNKHKEAQEKVSAADKIDSKFRLFCEKLLKIDELKSEIRNPPLPLLRYTPKTRAQSTRILKSALQKYKTLLPKVESNMSLLDPYPKLKRKIETMLKTEVKEVDSFIKGTNRMISILEDKDYMKEGKGLAKHLNKLIEQFETRSKTRPAYETAMLFYQGYNLAMEANSELVKKYKNANRNRYALPHYEKLNVDNNLYKTVVTLMNRLIEKLSLDSPRGKYRLAEFEVKFIQNNEDVLASLLFDKPTTYDISTIKRRLEGAYKSTLKHSLSRIFRPKPLGPTLTRGFEKHAGKGPQLSIQ